MYYYLYTALSLLLFGCTNTPDSKPTLVSNIPPTATVVANKALKTSADSTLSRPTVSTTTTNNNPPASGNKLKRLPTVIEPTSPIVPNVVIRDQFAHSNHLALDSLLQQYVSNDGKVNYKKLKANKLALNKYCQRLSDHPVQDHWSRAEKMAYWINAYNAFTLQLIVENYPTKSILSFDNGKTWDVRRIRIGDKKYSLNNIENDILRPVFKDPRIHFVLNCAAQSCPPLWNRAFTAENLEEALESRTRAFVNNSAFNTLSTNRIQVSKIFEWYGTDFGDLPKFLNKYANSPINGQAAIVIKEYNWDLNEG